MPIRNRNGGLHRGTLFDTNVPSTSIDKDIFTDQEVEDTIASDDLILMLDVSEDPDKIKYMTRSNFVDGLSGGTITITDNESTDENNLIAFVADAATTTGLHGMEMDGDFHYNPSTGTVTATNFAGTASTATVATTVTITDNESTSETNAVIFTAGGDVDGGNLGLESDGDFTYNPSSGTVGATIFSGALSGNATTATALASGRTIGMTGDVVWTSASFDGSGNVTGTATIQANSVALGTDTTGDYVSQITGGTGIDSTAGTSGEGTSHTLSVDLAEVGEVSIAHGDYIAFMDATDSNATKKEAIEDVAELFAGTGLTASSSVIGVDASQTQITGVGTITTGTWEATDVDVAHGGTGVSSLTANAILTGNGTSAIQAETDLLFSSNKLIPTAAAHDAAGTALTISAGATTAGTSNNQAGGALTIQGGQGKGSGAGGAIVFQVANEAGSGSSINSLATALTINDDSTITTAGAIELGHASDTTIARSGSGDITIEGNAVYRAGGTDVAVADGGTGASTLNNLITMGTHTTGNYVATVTAGTGLTSSGATSGESIAHSLSVDASQTQITSVGTIGTGTWEATDIAVAHGGTGASTATAGFDALSPMTAEGDILYGGSSGTVTKLAKGSDADVLTLASGVPSWATPTTGDITGVTAGNGLSGGGSSGGVSLALDLSELTDTAIANGDYIVFTDTTDSNASVKGDLADVATLFAGTGLTASSSVIGVDASQTQITAVGTIATGVWEATDVAVAHGGTGASTATAGFDALSPMTAEGDILYGGSSGTVTKLAKGSDGEYLKLASGVPSWASVASAAVTALNSATANELVTVGSTTTELDAEANLTYASDLLTTASSSADLPRIDITNTHAGATAGKIRFNKDSASGDDNDVMGTIEWYGTDAAENTHEKLAYIDSYIIDSAHGSEAAGLRFYVAENDATNTLGLQILGQADDDGEVDIVLGAGAASTTTIAGTLTMGSTAAMTNAGLVSVANQSNITGVGTISSGTWEATDVAVAHGGTGASSAGDARTNLGLGTAAVAATGISNTNVPVFTSGVADDDFLRVDGTSIEGRSASEVASDIGAATVGLSVAMAIAL
jgi:hypothetical protein